MLQKLDRNVSRNALLPELGFIWITNLSIDIDICPDVGNVQHTNKQTHINDIIKLEYMPIEFCSPLQATAYLAHMLANSAAYFISCDLSVHCFCSSIFASWELCNIQ